MTEPKNAPKPGAATSENALQKIKDEVAARNAAAHKAERARTDPRAKAAADKRRRDSW